MEERIKWDLKKTMPAAVLTSVLLWNLLFQRNPLLGPVLFEIHMIFIGTQASFVLIKLVSGEKILEFIKITTRTIFRVWLLIVITFTIMRPSERVGYLLSITFIFGYLEAMLDIDRWMHQLTKLPNWLNPNNLGIKTGQLFFNIAVLSFIHIIGAFVVLVFYYFFK